MKKSLLPAILGVTLLGVAASSAVAAPDWGKVPKRDIQVFHPSVSPIEWVTKKSDHSGSTGLRKGESCVGCHEERNGLLNFDFKRMAGKELEPVGAPKTMNYPVGVQAAYDKDSLYVRLTFKAPSGGVDKGDKDNELKATILLGDAKVPQGTQVGCWATCHTDARSMPGADEKKTKYVKDGSYELVQWASKGSKSVAGSVGGERKMTGGAGKAEGGKSGDTYTITFTAKNPGEGKTVPFGFAIHADHAHARFHHVSLGYTLGIGAEGDIKVAKQ